MSNKQEQLDTGGDVGSTEARRLYVLEFGRASNFARDLKQLGAAGGELIRAHERWLMETWYIRIVDNYLKYLEDLLVLVFQARPEVLRSNETVTWNEALRHSSIDELAQTLAERKVEALSRESMRKIAGYFQDRLELRLAVDDDDLKHLIRIVATRNVVVHARGIVTKTFNRDVANEHQLPVGQPIALERSRWMSDIARLDQSCKNVDTAAIKKFGLPTTSTIDVPAPRPKQCPCS